MLQSASQDEEVDTVWITENGTPLENVELTEWVKSTIRTILPQGEGKPEKKVTPSVIRRSIPSNFLLHALETGMDVSIIKENLAILLNTSIKMIEEYYDRTSNQLRMSSFLSELNSTTTSGSRSGRIQKRVEKEIEVASAMEVPVVKHKRNEVEEDDSDDGTESTEEVIENAEGEVEH
jgi:cobalamin-dependent methionine synthase I